MCIIRNNEGKLILSWFSSDNATKFNALNINVDMGTTPETKKWTCFVEVHTCYLQTGTEISNKLWEALLTQRIPVDCKK